MKSILYKIILSAVVCIVSSVVFIIDWPTQFAIAGVLYFMASYMMNSKNASWKEGWINMLILAIPFFAVYGIGSLVNKSVTTYPIWIISLVNTIAGNIVASLKTKAVRITTFILIVVLTGGMGYIGMKNWITYVRNKEAFVKEPVPPLNLFDDNNNKVSLSQFKGKTIILDFWSTSCAPCIKKFPELEKIYLKYLHDTSVVVYSVYLPLAGDNQKQINSFGNIEKYKFNKLYCYDFTSWNALMVKFMPYLIVIDKSFTIRYRGSFHTEWQYFTGNAYRVINGIKDEE